MKKFFCVCVFLTGTLSIYCQTKNDDILKFLRISGGGDLAIQMLDAIIPQFQQLLPDIPSTVWEKFKQKLDIDDLLYALIPVYSNYFTHDEIKELIVFYESPIGRKTVEVNPLIMRESMSIGQKWGEKISREIVAELIEDGYITD